MANRGLGNLLSSLRSSVSNPTKSTNESDSSTSETLSESHQSENNKATTSKQPDTDDTGDKQNSSRINNSRGVGSCLKQMQSSKDKFYEKPQPTPSKVTIFTKIPWPHVESMDGFVHASKRNKKCLDVSFENLSCDVCNITCTGRDGLDAHLKGKKHRKMLVKIESGLVTPAYLKANETPLRVDSKIQHELYELACTSEPIIGTDFVVEKRTQPGNVSYFCELCDTHASSASIIEHIIGQKHRLRFMKENHYSLFCDITGYPDYAPIKSSELTEEVKSQALEIMRKCGGAKCIGKIRVVKVQYDESKLIEDPTTVRNLIAKTFSKDLLLVKEEILKRKEKELEEKERKLIEKQMEMTSKVTEFEPWVTGSGSRRADNYGYCEDRDYHLGEMYGSPRQVGHKRSHDYFHDESNELTRKIRRETEMRETHKFVQNKIFNALCGEGPLAPIAQVFEDNPTLNAALRQWEGTQDVADENFG